MKFRIVGLTVNKDGEQEETSEIIDVEPNELEKEKGIYAEEIAYDYAYNYFDKAVIGVEKI